MLPNLSVIAFNAATAAFALVVSTVVWVAVVTAASPAVIAASIATRKVRIKKVFIFKLHIK